MFIIDIPFRLGKIDKSHKQKGKDMYNCCYNQNKTKGHLTVSFNFPLSEYSMKIYNICVDLDRIPLDSDAYEFVANARKFDWAFRQLVKRLEIYGIASKQDGSISLLIKRKGYVIEAVFNPAEFIYYNGVNNKRETLTRLEETVREAFYVGVSNEISRLNEEIAKLRKAEF